jgi:hypothetical protein
MNVNKPKSPPRTSAGAYNPTIADSGRRGSGTEVGDGEDLEMRLEMVEMGDESAGKNSWVSALYFSH